jgi:hypothetical protein
VAGVVLFQITDSINLSIVYRYGSPGNITKEYTQFAEWYLKAFSGKKNFSR